MSTAPFTASGIRSEAAQGRTRPDPVRLLVSAHRRDLDEGPANCACSPDPGARAPRLRGSCPLPLRRPRRPGRAPPLTPSGTANGGGQRTSSSDRFPAVPAGAPRVMGGFQGETGSCRSFWRSSTGSSATPATAPRHRHQPPTYTESGPAELQPPSRWTRKMVTAATEPAGSAATYASDTGASAFGRDKRAGIPRRRSREYLAVRKCWNRTSAIVGLGPRPRWWGAHALVANPIAHAGRCWLAEAIPVSARFPRIPELAGLAFRQMYVPARMQVLVGPRAGWCKCCCFTPDMEAGCRS